MDIEVILEAEKRGILPDTHKALLAEARKRGLVPDGGAKPQQGQSEEKQKDPDGNAILGEILNENKGYGKVFNTDNTKVVLAPKDRKRDGFGEFWPANEAGTEDLPHPDTGKNVIEIYDESLMKDPARLKAHIEGELYHGMKDDPEFNKMREDFKDNYTPTEAKRIKNGTSWWGDANVDKNSDADSAIHDAYIRGVNDPDFMEGVTSGKLEYSAKQQDIVGNMQKYIKTGVEPEKVIPEAGATQ
jgi:hypothetical protein